MDVDLDITDDLDVYVEEDNNNNLDAKEEEDNNIDVLCVQTFHYFPQSILCHSGFGTCATGTSPSPYFAI